MLSVFGLLSRVIFSKITRKPWFQVWVNDVFYEKDKIKKTKKLQVPICKLNSKETAGRADAKKANSSLTALRNYMENAISMVPVRIDKTVA